MPNWAYQELWCKTEEDLEKIRECFSNEYGDLDFDKVIPMPETIRLAMSPCDEKAIAFYLLPAGEDTSVATIMVRFQMITDDLEMRRKFLTPENIKKMRIIVEDEKYIEKLTERLNHDSKFLEYCRKEKILPVPENYGKQILTNLVQYGAIDWYDWSIKNWDVKWSASGVYWGNQSVYYETPWGASFRIPKEISRKLEIDIFMEWAEEQLSEYGGIVQFHNGEIVLQEDYNSQSEEMFIVASRLNDPDQTNIRYDTENGIFRREWDEEPKDFDAFPVLDTTLEELEYFLHN